MKERAFLFLYFEFFRELFSVPRISIMCYDGKQKNGNSHDKLLPLYSVLKYADAFIVPSAYLV